MDKRIVVAEEEENKTRIRTEYKCPMQAKSVTQRSYLKKHVPDQKNILFVCYHLKTHAHTCCVSVLLLLLLVGLDKPSFESPVNELS